MCRILSKRREPLTHRQKSHFRRTASSMTNSVHSSSYLLWALAQMGSSSSFGFRSHLTQFVPFRIRPAVVKCGKTFTQILVSIPQNANVSFLLQSVSNTHFPGITVTTGSEVEFPFLFQSLVIRPLNY